MTRNEQVAWAAGLFEGEGSLHVSTTDGRWGHWYMQLSMTDEDAVRIFHEFVGVGTVNGPYWGHNSTKSYWTWQCGRNEDTLSLANMLYPYLCARRQEKIRECRADMYQYSNTKANGQPKGSTE
jgi:hypothetical protein